MTDVKEMIEVMQAFAAGKKIERTSVFGLSSWAVTDNPVWDWAGYKYRVAEEKECVVYVVLGRSELHKLNNTLLIANPASGLTSKNGLAVFAKREEAEKFRDAMAGAYSDVSYYVMEVKVIK